MKPSGQYHKWVEWSGEDHIDIGHCPDVMTGIHGDDPVRLYRELCEVVDEVICRLVSEGRPLPHPRVRLMQEVG